MEPKETSNQKNRCMQVHKQIPSIRSLAVPKYLLNIPWNVIWKYLTLSTFPLQVKERMQTF